MTKAARARKIIVYILYVLILSCFQVSFPDILSFHGQIADLMFVFAVVSSYMFGFRDGYIVCIFLGIIRDYFSGPSIIGLDGNVTSTIGIGMLVIFLAGFWGSIFLTKRLNRSVLIVIGAVESATLIYKVMGYVLIKLGTSILYGKTYSLGFGDFLLNSVLPQLLLNLVVAVIIYFMLIFIGPYRRGSNPNLINEKGNDDTQWLTS